MRVSVDVIILVMYHQYIGGPGSLQDQEKHTYLECIFFSIQTMSTIGYGVLAPKTIYTNLIVLIQSWFALLVECLLIGLFYHKFSRPSRLRTRILFSTNAVVNRSGLKQDSANQQDSDYYFVFRVVNGHKPQFVDAKIRLLLLQWDKYTTSASKQSIDQHSRKNDNMALYQESEEISLLLANGNEEEAIIPRIYELDFEVNIQSKRPRGMDYSLLALPMPWTIVHKLDKESPLTPLLLNGNPNKESFEVIALFSGVEESISDSVQARYSYIEQDIKMNYRFVPCMCYRNNAYEIDINLLSKILPTQEGEQ